MREIQFRGKDENGVWVYGSLVVRSRAYGTKSSILEMTIDPTEPDVEHNVQYQTIGQFTGLLDKNGVKIWEGDVVNLGEADANVQVFWSKEALAFLIGSGLECVPLNWFSDKYNASKVFVIGNIHDNPELLTPQVSKEGGENESI